MIKVRARAAAWHLVVSMLVLALIYAWLRLVWYPEFLFEKLGGAELFIVLLIVDALLGPLCTLIVYNPSKASLRFDMTAIVALQLAALGYGLFTFWAARPVYMVFSQGEITVVTAVELSEPGVRSQEGTEHWFPLPQFGPRLVAANLPRDPAELGDFVFNSLMDGQGLPQSPRYYVPYIEAQDQVLATLREIDDLELPSVDSLREKLNKVDAENIGFLPVIVGRQKGVAILDKATGNIVSYLNVTPRP